MAYADIYNAANDSMFQGRCRVALWIAADSIIAEDPATPNHEARVNWALTAQQNRLHLTQENLAQAVLRNPSIAANPGASSDSDIQFQVNSLIDWLIAAG